MTTIQEASAKGLGPTRANRLMEMANTVALWVVIAMATVIVGTILVAVAHGAEGNHNGGTDARGKDTSSTASGSGGGYYQGAGNFSTLGQMFNYVIGRNQDVKLNTGETAGNEFNGQAYRAGF